MLILTRKSGESISIGNNITVKILGISAKQVKLGIEAPDGIPVYREEVRKKISEKSVKTSISLKEDLIELARLIKSQKTKKKKK